MKKATKSNLIKVTIALSDKAVVFHYYNTHDQAKIDQSIEDYFILRESKPNYNAFKSFAYSCLPTINFERLTFAEVDKLCEELFNQQMNIALKQKSD